MKKILSILTLLLFFSTNVFAVQPYVTGGNLHDHAGGDGLPIPAAGLADNAVTIDKISDNVITPIKLNRLNNPTDNYCLQYNLADTNFKWGTCGTGAGNPSFTDITTGVNTTATMTLGTGGTLTFSGSGVVNANQFFGVTSVDATEFGYLNGVTSDIQTQFGAKVTGPGSATDNAIALFDSTTGKLIKDSTYTISAQGAALIDDADATAQRTTLGLGSIATFSGDQNLATTDNVTFNQITTTEGVNTGQSASQAGRIRLYELLGNGTDYIAFQAPDNLAATLGPYIFPDTAGSNGQILKLGADNVTLSWSADATGGSPTFDTIASGTNTTATMTVGTGGTLNYSGSGIIDATRFLGVTTVDATEFGYLNGVTSDIQTQFGAKVTGPASATDNAIVIYDGTTGKLVKDSTYPISAQGAALIDDVDAAAQRTTLGLGSIATFSGDQNLATTDNVTFNKIAVTEGIDTGQSASEAGSIRLYELSGNGTDYIAFQAPDNLASTLGPYILPDTAGSNGQILKLGADNVTLSWAADATGGSPTFDTIASGTNTTATMTVDTGATLTYANSGIINATRFLGVTTVDATEFGYIDGLTSNAQAQLTARVVGPGVVSDNTIVLFDSTTGKLIKASECTISDNVITCPQSASAAGGIKFYELSGNGTDYTGFQAPDNLAATIGPYILPNTAGVSGDVLKLQSDNVTLLWSNGSTETIEFIIGNNSDVITTGVKGYIEIPWNCTIVASRLISDASGSIVIDVWKDTYANFPPDVADTITASAKPTLSTAQKAEDTTLTGWTTSISAGEWLGYNVDSASTVKRVTLSLTVVKQ